MDLLLFDDLLRIIERESIIDVGAEARRTRESLGASWTVPAYGE